MCPERELLLAQHTHTHSNTLNPLRVEFTIIQCILFKPLSQVFMGFNFMLIEARFCLCHVTGIMVSY